MPLRTFSAVLSVLLCVFMLAGCDRGGYSQSSPDAVVESAAAMVAAGRAEKLPDLFYAESDQMRSLYRRLGRLLGSVQDLSDTIKAKFPDELTKLQEQAKTAAATGQSTGLLQQLMSQGRGNRRGAQAGRGAAGGQNRSQTEQAFQIVIRQFLADPYAWLSTQRDKLSTTYLADDTAALLWDGKPALAPIGVTMMLSDGKWYIVLPTNIPGASRFLPKTEDEFKIWGSLFVTFDKVVQELTQDVESGKLKSLDQVAEEAGRKAFIPAAMVLYAYNRALSDRRRDERAAQQQQQAPASAPAPAGG